MDYLGFKCPVCEKYFHANDDIVVCPECGTPHHRACYEENGKCFYESRHSEGFDFNDETSGDIGDNSLCKKCGQVNRKDAFFCNHCGAPMTDEPQPNTADRQQNVYSQPGVNIPGGMPVDMFDPLAGVPQDFDMGDGVTAGEVAKYVKQNPPYFVRVFHNIRSFSKSKFNFAAAIFTGGYLLYRKMYKIGAIVTAIQVAMLLFVTYIYNSAEYRGIFEHITTLYSSAGDYTQAAAGMMEYMATLTTFQNFIIVLPAIYELLQVIAMITIGACANRLYFSHCKKNIVNIKAQCESSDQAETRLQTKGGVNTALAVSLMITYMLINYLPAFLISIF